MPLESATYISDLDVSNPVATDGLNQADDHLRLVKSTLKTTFPNVTGEVAADHTDLGNGFVPIGGIIMWSGSVASIPANWVLCNGLNSTPDLRDKFVIGAGSTYSPGATGGSTTTSSAGSHTHVTTLSSSGNHNHGTVTGAHELTMAEVPSVFSNGSTGGLDPVFENTTLGSVTGKTGTGHTHSISDDGAHIHTPTVETVADHSHTATPPYYALAYIMRSA